MPEGPSLVILKEALKPFRGKVVQHAAGSASAVPMSSLTSLKLMDIKTWGKHLLLCFHPFTLRIHLLMFGSYTINARKSARPRLSLQFANGEVNFYTCAVRRIDQPLDEVYDWQADVLGKQWNARKALARLRAQPNRLVCDALLDQQIFSGVGNIIKIEVLFRIRVHPLSKVGSLSPFKLRQLVKEAVHYSYQFLAWKKSFVLKKNWLVIGKKKCPRDGHAISKAYLGAGKRRTFFCSACQKLYDQASPL